MGEVARVASDTAKSQILYGLLGHSQPFAQSSQQSHSQLQSGQSLQQSSEQQEPSLQTGSLEVFEEPTMPAAIRPDATARPPINLINMTKTHFLVDVAGLFEAGVIDPSYRCVTFTKKQKLRQVRSPWRHDVRRMHQINQEQCRMRCGMGGGRSAGASAAAILWASVAA